MTELLQRLSKELKTLGEIPQGESLILSLGPDYHDPNCDPLVWFCQINGPPGSPYEGGVFTLKITITDDYPNKPPLIEFVTPIFHPNVQNGKICLDLLDNESSQWKNSMHIQTAVFAILQMMLEANPEGGFEEVSKLILRDRPKWFAIAEEMTRKHAK